MIVDWDKADLRYGFSRKIFIEKKLLKNQVPT